MFMRLRSPRPFGSLRARAPFVRWAAWAVSAAVAAGQSPPVPPAATVFGFDHFAIGAASISGGSSVAVSSATPAAPFGVATEFTDSEGFRVTIDDPDPTGALPAGARLDFAAYGAVGAAAPAVVATVRGEKVGGSVNLSVLAGSGYATGTLVAFLNGNVVATAPFSAAGGGNVAVALHWPKWFQKKSKRSSRCSWPANDCSSLAFLPGPDYGAYWLGLEPFTGGAGGQAVALQGGTLVVTADLLCLVPDASPTAAPTRITRSECTATDLTSFGISECSLYAFDQFHLAVNAGTLAYSAGALTATAPSGGGVYGIDARFPDSNQFAVAWLNPDAPIPAPVGSTLAIEAVGSVNSGPTQSLGVATATKTATGYELTADFSAISSPTQTVQLVLGGSIVATYGGRSGTLAAAALPPHGCGKVVGPPWCYFWNWPLPLAIAVPGTPTLMADEVRILSEGPAASGVESGFRLRAFGPASLTIVGESHGAVAPANDDCVGAIPIVVGANGPFDNLTATTSYPTGSCGLIANDVWFAITAPCAGGKLIVDTCGSAIDTVVSVYDACGLGSLELGCNDDAGAAGPCAATLQSYLEIPAVAGVTYFVAVGGFAGQRGSFAVNVRCEYAHRWTSPAGPGSIQLENVDGPANTLAFSAVTLDLLHPGLPTNETFPNGWFFGVPMGFPELFQQISWPGGLPFAGILDASGYSFNFALPAGTTSGLAGIATMWSVGVAFDPLTGFTTIADTTAPTAFAL